MSDVASGGVVMRNLESVFCTTAKKDVIIDTDLYNEVDDYYAIALLFGHQERFNIKGVTIAPFFNKRVSSIAESIEKSTEDVNKLFELMGKKSTVYPGGISYLPDERTPVPSEAADFMIECSKMYNENNRLYIIAIGAITTVASAILKDPTIVNRIAVVWLGGNAEFVPENKEFNLIQDVAAARVVMGSDVPFLQVPCMGVVSAFTTGYYELEHFIKDKNLLCDLLFERTAVVAMEECEVPTWSRVLWDVVAVAALLNDNGKFMEIAEKNRRLPAYETGLYEEELDKKMLCVEKVHRDELLYDLFLTLEKF